MSHHIIDKAESIITSVEQNLLKSKKSACSKQILPGFKSLHHLISQAYSESTGKAEKNSFFTKRRKMAPNNLRAVCMSHKKMNRLIVNLFPLNDGYSLMLFINGHTEESKRFTYDEYEILDYIDKEQIPHMLLDSLRNIKESLMYDGCIVAELRDYRMSADPSFYLTHYILLRPSQQTLLNDIDSITKENIRLNNWNKEDCDTFASGLIMATSEPLCLDPSPVVAVIKNELERRRNPFFTSSVRRHIKRNGPRFRLRTNQLKSYKPRIPKIFVFADLLANRSKQTCADLKLTSNKMDLWRKTPLPLNFPSVPLDVMKLAKVVPQRPEQLNNIDLVASSTSSLHHQHLLLQIQVQHVLFRCESSSKDTYSQITIYQRPSTMEYYGRLRSNKFFQSESLVQISHSCIFLLGSKKMATNYLLQFQELFSEDGRRTVTISTSRAPGVAPSKTEVPLQQQPWQIEQDTTAFKIGSVNDIDHKYWDALKLLPHQKFQLSSVLRQNPSVTVQRQKANAAAAAAVAAAASSASNHQTASHNMALKMQQQKQQLLKKQQAFRLTKQRVQRRVGTSSHSDAITTSNGNQISLIEAAYQSAADEITSRAGLQRSSSLNSEDQPAIISRCSSLDGATGSIIHPTNNSINNIPQINCSEDQDLQIQTVTFNSNSPTPINLNNRRRLSNPQFQTTNQQATKLRLPITKPTPSNNQQPTPATISLLTDGNKKRKLSVDSHQSNHMFMQLAPNTDRQVVYTQQSQPTTATNHITYLQQPQTTISLQPTQNILSNGHVFSNVIQSTNHQPQLQIVRVNNTNTGVSLLNKILHLNL